MTLSVSPSQRYLAAALITVAGRLIIIIAHFTAQPVSALCRELLK